MSLLEKYDSDKNIQVEKSAPAEEARELKTPKPEIFKQEDTQAEAFKQEDDKLIESAEEKTAEKAEEEKKRGLGAFFKRNKIFFITFGVAFLIMLFAFAVNGMFPFGDRQILIIDAWHQYYPFLSELHTKLQTGGSLFYNHNIGLGVNFWLLSSYYTNSPLNLLSILFPHAFLTEFMMFATITKIALAATFMAMLLSYLTKKRNLMTMLFGLAYAFSTYFMGYYWCIMWLDAVAMLPLIILGLHKLMCDGKPGLYACTLGIAIISNYYIGYMLCLFIAIYYIYVNLTTDRVKFTDFLVRTIIVLFYSVMGVALSAFVLLPTVKGMQLASSANFTFPKKFIFERDFITVINRMLPSSKPAVVEGLPNIAVGTFGLYMLFYYFKNKEISIYEKIASFIFLLFIFMGFIVNIPNFIWHGLHYTNGIPFRYAFVFVFMLVLLGGRGSSSIESLKQVRASDALTFAAILIGYMLFAESAGGGERNIKPYVAVISSITLLAFGAALSLWSDGKSRKKGFSAALATLVVLESIGLSIFGVAVSGSSSRSKYRLYGEDVKAALAEMRSIDDGIYRTEMARIYTTNDSSVYGYRGASVFSSTLNGNVTKFVTKLGAMGNVGSNRYSLPMSTPLFDSLFNIKYFIGRDELGSENFTGYTERGVWNKVRLMQNDNVLPFGFFVPERIRSYSGVDINPFRLQESIYSCMLGENFECFSQLIPELQIDNAGFNYDSDIRYNYRLSSLSEAALAHFTFTAPEDGDYYIYCYAPKGEKGVYKIYQDSDAPERKEYYEVRRGVIVPTGQMKAGGKISVDIELEKNHSSHIDFVIMKMDYPKFVEARDKIASNPFEITEFKDTKIEGRINAPKDGYAFISLPYEAGWSCEVNGEAVALSSLKDAMILVPVKAGENLISLKYVPDGFKLGAIISLFALLTVVLPPLIFLEITRLLDKKAKKQKAATENISEAAQ